MTGEQRQMINACKLKIIGSEMFLKYLREELRQLGFNVILNITALKDYNIDETNGILIEFTGNCPSQSTDSIEIPVIYPFDFIAGAGVIVLFPGDDRKWLEKPNLRLWAAEYMMGYCAFWNISGCDWLHDVLPAIKAGETSDSAQKTAAYISARIAANIATGRPVKRFPKFYIVDNKVGSR